MHNVNDRTYTFAMLDVQSTFSTLVLTRHTALNALNLNKYDKYERIRTKHYQYGENHDIQPCFRRPSPDFAATPWPDRQANIQGVPYNFVHPTFLYTGIYNTFTTIK
jgi:hypothetical protein